MIKKIALSATLLFFSNSFTGIVEDIRAEVSQAYGAFEQFLKDKLGDQENTRKENDNVSRNEGRSPRASYLREDNSGGARRAVAHRAHPVIAHYLNQALQLAVNQDVEPEKIIALLADIKMLTALVSAGLAPRDRARFDQSIHDIETILDQNKAQSDRSGFANLAGIAGTSSAVLRRAQPAKPK